jgi:Tol biopolymer transport system component
VRVTDRYDNPVTAAPVTFTVISGTGTIDGGTAVTDLLGIATSGAWTLGLEPGPQQVGVQAESAQTLFTAIACDGACRELSLAFMRDGGIVVTSFDSTSERFLTTSGRDDRPAWSPDGRRIAFVRWRPNWAGDIYLVDADGFNAVPHWSGGGAFDFRSAAWSPDGRTLAVDHGNWYDGDIYLLSVDDTGTAPVHVASMAAMPAWSPDGRKIAFVSLSGDDGYHALHVMNADGSNVTALTLRDRGAIEHPTWSPDGQRIAFTKCIDGACDIVAVSANATAVTVVDRLTTVGNAFSPAWSPDGFWIAFTVGNYPAYSVVYVAANGGDEPMLLGSGSRPAWRP